MVLIVIHVFQADIFHVMKNQFCKRDLERTFSIFHNNIISLKKNLDSLQCEILDELDFHFDLLGVTETKITNLHEHCAIPNIPGYNFEHVPTPLSAGGNGLFIDQSLDYLVPEKTSTSDFQALCIDVCFVKQKNLVCGIIYRQHNSPEQFKSYIDETIEKFISAGKKICLLGDTNLDLMKSARCNHTNEFLSTLMSCHVHLIPTVDKPTRVYKKSATLIDKIFVSYPEDVLISGNIVSDITDHFSHVCLLSSSKEFHGEK